MANKKQILKWTFISLWVMLGAGVLTLLIAAVKKEEAKKCTGLNITIKGVSNNFFVDKNDIMAALNEYVDGTPVGQAVSVLNLKSLEDDLKKNVWVKQVQLFFDNNGVLQITVTEREPVARVFSSAGTTFYVDSSNAMLPLSEKFSARLPVFTNFPSDKAVLSKADSALLRDVCNISMAMQQDSFIMAMVEQVDINKHRLFEMVPKMGNNIIAFGDASDIQKKFSRLKLFYSEVLPKCGWDYYSQIDVQYAGQVVAKRKGAADKSADSLRTLQLMQMIAKTAEDLANDSLQTIMQDNEHNTTDFNLIQQSIQRDDDMEPSKTTEANSLNQTTGVPVFVKPVLPESVPVKSYLPAAKKTAAAPTAKTPAVTKRVPAAAAPVKPKSPATNNKPATTKPKPVPLKTNFAKPKAVMPKTNDY